MCQHLEYIGREDIMNLLNKIIRNILNNNYNINIYGRV